MSDVEFSSDAVRAVKFAPKLRGYSTEEVDAFVEGCARALDQLTRQLDELTARAVKAEGALATHTDSDESVRRTLVLAQRTAEMAIREATEEANRLRAEARLDSERARTTARTEAANLAADARQRVADMEREAERTRAAAIEHATATVDEADATAQATVAQAHQQAATIRADVDAEIAGRRETAQRELTDWSAEERGKVQAAVDLLEGQKAQLWADVANLGDYLAAERARVLDVLATAVERFGETLAPAALPASLASEPEPEMLEPSVEAETAEPSVEAEAPQPVEAEEPHEVEVAVEAEVAVETEVASEREDEHAAASKTTDAHVDEAQMPDDPRAEPVHASEPDVVDVVDVVEAVEHGATAADADADADEHANEHDDDSLTVDGVLAVAPVHTGPDGPEMEPDGTRAMAEDEDEEPADFDDAPASLLFSLKDERGRSDNDRSDIPVESKPRKTLLGRRRP